MGIDILLSKKNKEKELAINEINIDVILNVYKSIDIILNIIFFVNG